MVSSLHVFQENFWSCLLVSLESVTFVAEVSGNEKDYDSVSLQTICIPLQYAVQG